MSAVVVIRRPGRPMIVPVLNRRRRWVRSVVLGMRRAGWPPHAIGRALRLPRHRVERMLTQGGRSLADLAAQAAREIEKEAAA
jgi:hypothetical protein